MYDLKYNVKFLFLNKKKPENLTVYLMTVCKFHIFVVLTTKAKFLQCN